MSNYKYQVVPFIGKIKGKQSADEVSKQLESVIEQYSSQGWEFYQLADVSIEVSPGCLASLFGAKESYMKFDQIIFRKQINSN